MSNANFHVALHHLAQPLGCANQLAAWHYLRQRAPVGHLPLAEAKTQIGRLCLPPDDILGRGDGLFWTQDSANTRLFLHAAQRITLALAERLGLKGVAKCYLNSPVVVLDRRGAFGRSSVGTLVSTLTSGPGTLQPAFRLLPTPHTTEVIFVDTEIERIDLAPGIPTIHLHLPALHILHAETWPNIEIVYPPRYNANAEINLS